MTKKIKLKNGEEIDVSNDAAALHEVLKDIAYWLRAR